MCLSSLHHVTLRMNHSHVIRFRYKEGLVYFVSGDDLERLCIPATMKSEMFKQAHDLTHHDGFHRTYDRLRHSIYVRRMVKHLKAYITHCPECQVNQTKRHPTYGELNPVTSPAIPFHTITMDFVVALPLSRGYNMLLTITCKFTKRILLLPGHDTWDASGRTEVFRRLSYQTATASSCEGSGRKSSSVLIHRFLLQPLTTLKQTVNRSEPIKP